MTAENPNRIEFVPQIPYHLRPFRPDNHNLPAIFFSNGYKSRRSNEIGIPTYSYQVLADAMETAENNCHDRYKPKSALGPITVDGIPYPIMTAIAKGEAARQILWKDGYRTGTGVVSDVVIGFIKNGRSFEITAHKLKTEKDREVLARALYAADLAGDVEIKTYAAMYRFDLSNPKKSAEIYLCELDQGHVQIDDMTTLLQKLQINSRTSGSLDTPFMLNHLSHHENKLKAKLELYDENQIKQYQANYKQSQRFGMVENDIQPWDLTYFDIPPDKDSGRFAETIALGFII